MLYPSGIECEMWGKMAQKGRERTQGPLTPK